MSSYYEILKAKDEQFYFVLKAGNGEVILTSELYTTKASAKNGIESVQINSKDDDKYELLPSKNEKFYFNLKAVNHQIIGTSQMYSTAQTRAKGIDSVKTNGPIATVKDLTV